MGSFLPYHCQVSSGGASDIGYLDPEDGFYLCAPNWDSSMYHNVYGLAHETTLPSQSSFTSPGTRHPKHSIIQKSASNQAPTSIPGQLELLNGNNNNNIACAQCGSSFTSKRELEHHAREADHKAFACNHAGCHKTFKNRTSPSRHMKSHASRRSFVCRDCGKGDDRRDHHKQHVQRVHSGDVRLHVAGGGEPWRQLQADQSWYPLTCAGHGYHDDAVQRDDRKISYQSSFGVKGR
ncbi:hypothetical protein BDV97DRAFT_369763 [Delphinella strobiligena]|nr:hypothetical protein BDV97DRAFT_369763 [Delphinella strobiligena]